MDYMPGQANKKYNPNLRENLIVNMTFEFSMNIISYASLLEAQRKFAIANQLIRSGTSVGANVREAQNAESSKDFVHKMKMAAKEADETEYFLELCHHSPGYPTCSALLAQILSVKKVLSKIIATSKKKLQQ